MSRDLFADQLVKQFDNERNDVWVERFMKREPRRTLSGTRCMQCLKNVEETQMDIYLYYDCDHFFCLPCYCGVARTWYMMFGQSRLPPCPLCENSDEIEDVEEYTNCRLILRKYTEAWGKFIPVPNVLFTTPQSGTSNVTITYHDPDVIDRTVKEEPVPIGRRLLGVETYCRFTAPNMFAELKRKIERLEDRVKELEEIQDASVTKKRRI